MVRERVNMKAREDRVNEDTVGHGNDDAEEKTAEKHLYEKPEGRDTMTDSNLKSEYNEANGVRKRVNVMQEQVDQHLKDPHDDVLKTLLRWTRTRLSSTGRMFLKSGWSL